MLKFSTSLDTWPTKNMYPPLNAHKSGTIHVVHDLPDVLSNHTTFKVQWTRIYKAQFAVYISDTPVILKQSQGHQTYNEDADPEQGYNHAEFERLH